jgi:hypothetical protein
MSVVPKEVVAKIQFYEDHQPTWSSNAVAIGTTTTEVTALQTKTAAARTAYDEQQAAQLAAKDATLKLRLAVEAMATAGGAIIKKVRAKAQTDGLGVYALASLPAPATPTPVPPPGTPTDFTATLNPDGSLKLRWKCANPAGSQGTFYQASRRVGNTGAFAPVGGTGNKSCVDATVPAGVAAVTYQVVAVRSTAMGVAAQFTVNFGVGGSGEMLASVASAPKLAA